MELGAQHVIGAAKQNSQNSRHTKPQNCVLGEWAHGLSPVPPPGDNIVYAQFVSVQ